MAWQWLISGFGEVRPTTGDRGYGQTASGPSYVQAVKFDLRYPGQVFDEETGLSYNLHRYYDAATGRYMQADPIGLEGGWNRFGYVGGNPLNWSDSRGLDNPGMGPYSSGVMVYYYGGGSGHVGVGINGSGSFGYYPTSPSKTNYELIFPGVPGTVELDAFHQKQPDKSIWIEGSQESVDLLKKYIKEMSIDPGVYSLPFNNCTTFVSDGLRLSNFKNVPHSVIPLSFIESLERLHGKK